MVVDLQGRQPQANPRTLGRFWTAHTERALLRGYLLLIDRDAPLSSLCRRC